MPIAHGRECDHDGFDGTCDRHLQLKFVGSSRVSFRSHYELVPSQNSWQPSYSYGSGAQIFLSLADAMPTGYHGAWLMCKRYRWSLSGWCRGSSGYRSQNVWCIETVVPPRPSTDGLWSQVTAVVAELCGEEAESPANAKSQAERMLLLNVVQEERPGVPP